MYTALLLRAGLARKDYEHTRSSSSSWLQLSPEQAQNTVTEGKTNLLFTELRPVYVAFCIQGTFRFDHHLLLNFLRHPVAFSSTTRISLSITPCPVHISTSSVICMSCYRHLTFAFTHVFGSVIATCIVKTLFN